MDHFDVAVWDDAAVRVVRVAGEFDIVARERFRAVSDRDDAELVVVDLRRTSFLDSQALAELIALHARTERRGARLAILRPDGAADDIFKLTGMDGHLPLYDDRVPLLAQFNYG